MEATKITKRSGLFKVQCYRNNKHKMKHKTDTYIFRVVHSIQCEIFNIFWLRKAEEMRNRNNKQKNYTFHIHISVMS